MHIFVPLGHDTNPKDKANCDTWHLCWSSHFQQLHANPACIFSPARQGKDMKCQLTKVLSLPRLPYYQCILQNHNKQGYIREFKITRWVGAVLCE